MNPERYTELSTTLFAKRPLSPGPWRVCCFHCFRSILPDLLPDLVCFAPSLFQRFGMFIVFLVSGALTPFLQAPLAGRLRHGPPVGNSCRPGVRGALRTDQVNVVRAPPISLSNRT